MTELSRICGPATKILGMCQCFLEMSCIHLLACSLLSVGGDWWLTVILEHARDIRIKKTGTIGVCISNSDSSLLPSTLLVGSIADSYNPKNAVSRCIKFQTFNDQRSPVSMSYPNWSSSLIAYWGDYCGATNPEEFPLVCDVQTSIARHFDLMLKL